MADDVDPRTPRPLAGILESPNLKATTTPKPARDDVDEASVSITDGLADAILATLSDAILATDRRGVIHFWNPGAARIFGFAAEEAVGGSLDLIIPERLRARHWDGYARVMATGATRYGSGDLLSVPALTKDGRQISVEFTIIVLHDVCGQLTGMAAILRDVTSRFEELRGLKRRLAVRGHEFNGET